MGDFIGIGRGWNRFKFVLTPNELKDVFQGLEYWFAITNSRVPVEYEVNDKESLFGNYLVLYNKIVSGQPWIRKEDFRIEMKVSLSITHDPRKITFERIEDKEIEDGHLYKLPFLMEPVIHISPFYLDYRNQELSDRFFNQEGIIGLELTFPKFAWFSDGGHKIKHDTATFHGKHLYDELVKRIKKKTKKAKLTDTIKTFKPNFWISESASQDINANWYLRQNNLRLN
jgi:hypothetical protein